MDCGLPDQPPPPLPRGPQNDKVWFNLKVAKAAKPQSEMTSNMNKERTSAGSRRKERGYPRADLKCRPDGRLKKTPKPQRLMFRVTNRH